MSEGQRGAPPPHGQVSPPADSPLLAQAGLIAKSPPNPTIQPRTSHPKLSLSYLPAGCFARGDVRRTEGVPSPAWTGLPASRLLSSHVRPPPHGQVSSPAGSPLPTHASPAWTSLLARSPPNPTIQPRTPHPKLSLSYLGEMSEGQRGFPPPHGQVSPPADSPLLTPTLPRMGQVSLPADSPLPTPLNPFPSVSP